MLSRRDFLKRTALFTPAMYGALSLIDRPKNAYGADRIAANATQAAVQAAVNLAVDGDRVLIPNGSATWTTGITTSKQIIIQAQNYTPTPGGTGTRNVTITNNSAGGLFAFNTGNSFHCGLGGIRFNEGTQITNDVSFSGSGSKVGLLFDCYFQVSARFGNAAQVSVVPYLGLGGVTWNCFFDGTGFIGGGGPADSGACSLVRSSRAWATASTMGMLDANGNQNTYFENCTWDHIWNQAIDVEDNGRAVIRHSTIRSTQFLTHGSTGLAGGRFVEFYNNAFQMRTPDVSLVRYMWFRAGTGLFADNTFEDIDSVTYGPQSEVVLCVENASRPGQFGCATSYPAFHQIGQGHNGTSQVSDPMYFWNNTGTMQISLNDGEPNTCGGTTSTYCQQNRDYFVNAGAKPGYTKFTYPHPFRAVVDGGGSPTPQPVPPQGLTVS